MSFSTDYTEHKVNELKELGIHPEKPDETYDVNAKDIKDYSPINTTIISIITLPWIFLALGVIFAPTRYVPEDPPKPAKEAAPAPAETAPAAAEAAPAAAAAEAKAGDEAMPAGEGDNQAKPAAPKAQ